jgi:hypothetical protein
VAARSTAARLLEFESRPGHGCLSLVSVVCCQVEVSATSWSLVQRSPSECDVSKKCVIVKPRKMRQPRPPRGRRAIGGGNRDTTTPNMGRENPFMSRELPN